MSIKIGIGYDIHKLAAGRKLMIGGVEVPYAKGLQGHSDADVLLHAICDALLGAAGEGDIGEHFPDGDPQYKDIGSGELVRDVYTLIRNKGYAVNNIDTVIIAQEPHLGPYKKQIRENIAAMLNIDKEMVGIKAKTNEGLGDIGKKGAIASYAVVLLHKED